MEKEPKKTMKIMVNTHAALGELMRGRETFDDLIRRLIGLEPQVKK